MSFEKEMYEIKEKWEESYFSDDDRRRIKFVHNLIPMDARTILDVGCGNGILVNYLSQLHRSQFERICATDRSKTSLEYVKTEKYESDITKLPFKDNEFDLVTCLEVIEHLPQEVYAAALKELQRVASKYLIISVPFNENLDISKIRCIKCATEFNPFYHMRSFNKESIVSLVSSDDMELVDVKEVELVAKPRFAKLKKQISRFLHPNSFPSNCICPMCGYNEFYKLKKSEKKSQEKKPSKGLSRMWPHFKEAKWIVGVYRHK